jgi:Ca2+-binding RTX toxin-like protein
MHATTYVPRHGRRALALAALASAFFAASLWATAPAEAAYTAKVADGTLTVKGDAESDRLVLQLRPGSPNVLDLDLGADGVADLSFDRGTFTAIEVSAGGGDDEVRVFNAFGAFNDEAVTLSGGGGNDTLRGGIGDETLIGGGGDDFVAGGDGNDTARLGRGNDRFAWNPGDDDDVVEGESGSDLLDFAGANVAETIDISANGPRVRFTRNIANIAMDLGGVERVGFRAVGGADTITVGHLAGTAAKTVEVDLAAVGGAGDGQADTVVLRATEEADDVEVEPSPSAVVADAGAALLVVTGSEEAHDSVRVAALGGDDTIETGIGLAGPAPVDVDGGEGHDTAQYSGTSSGDAIHVVANGGELAITTPGFGRVDTFAVESVLLLGRDGPDTITSVGNVAPLAALTMDGGAGDDVVLGGNGADLLLGGAGNDTVDGQQGADRALLGRDADTFHWDPGDGSDVVEGGGGEDELEFFASNAGETIEISANGSRARLTRNIASIVMDFHEIELADVRLLGGADTVRVGSLRGTRLRGVGLDLRAAGGAGDGQADSIVVDGTARDDDVQIVRAASDVLVEGLHAVTRIAGGEAALDTLLLQTHEGDDDVTVGPDVADLIAAAVDLGADD